MHGAPTPQLAARTLAAAVLSLALLGAASTCSRPGHQPPSAAPAAADPQPAPPPGVLGQITVGPLPQAFARLTAFGHRLGAWERQDDVFFAEIRALAEGVSDLSGALDWARPAHLLVLDAKRLPGQFALLLPSAKPAAALRLLATRCRGTQKGGVWHFTGGGAALLPCRFHARAVPGGLVVATQPLLVDALARYGQAVLDPRLRPAQAPPKEATGPATLVEARAFLPALRARFGLDAKKVSQWVDLAAMGIAMAAGDFTAAGDLKDDLRRLLAQLDSLQDAGLAFEIDAGGVALRLFATGQRGGALASWTRTRRPIPLRLHRRLEPGAAVALTVVGPGRTAGASPAAAPGGTGAQGAAPQRPHRAALGPLVDLLLPRLPAAYRAPARALWQALTGPEAGELAVALRRPDQGPLGLDLVLRHRQPAVARKALFEATLALVTALRDQLGPKGAAGAGAPFALQTHRGPDGDRIDLTPAGGAAGALAAALQVLIGGPALSVAVTHRGDAVALVFGVGAQKRAQALLAGPDPVAAMATSKAPLAVAPKTAPKATPEAAPRSDAASLPPAAPGTLGRVALSLVELGRLVPGLLPADAPPVKNAGAMHLAWGVRPADRRVELVVTLPVAHLKALAPLWQALSARLENSTDTLAGLLGEDDAEDAL